MGCSALEGRDSILSITWLTDSTVSWSPAWDPGGWGTQSKQAQVRKPSSWDLSDLSRPPAAP